MACIFKKIRTLRANNSRILSIQNAKFSGYHFSINANIWRDFQICISVPLRTWEITVFSGFRKFSNALRLRYLWVKTPVSYEIMIMKRQSKISKTKWRALLWVLWRVPPETFDAIQGQIQTFWKGVALYVGHVVGRRRKF